MTKISSNWSEKKAVWKKQFEIKNRISECKLAVGTMHMNPPINTCRNAWIQTHKRQKYAVPIQKCDLMADKERKSETARWFWLRREPNKSTQRGESNSAKLKNGLLSGALFSRKLLLNQLQKNGILPQCLGSGVSLSGTFRVWPSGARQKAPIVFLISLCCFSLINFAVQQKWGFWLGSRPEINGNKWCVFHSVNIWMKSVSQTTGKTHVKRKITMLQT